MEPDETPITKEEIIAKDRVLGSPTRAVIEELLIEEISIDGMCGVY